MDTLVNLEVTPETITFIHQANNRAVLETVHQERQKGHNGWNQSRTMQHVGSIPALEYHRLCQINPELKDPNRLEKWLMSSEGAAYRIVEDGRHRSSQIIIK